MRLLRMTEVVELVGLKRAAIYGYIARGRFPRAVQVGRRAVRWRSEDIEGWLASLPPADGRGGGE